MANKKATVQQVSGITFAGKTDTNHWVMMDGPSEFGGSDAAIRPKELLLLSLGGCTGSDVASILTKKRVPYRNLKLELEAEVSDTQPQVYTRINIHYIVEGKDVNPSDVEKAISLSQEKYCGVTKMLKASIDITTSFEVVTRED